MIVSDISARETVQWQKTNNRMVVVVIRGC